MTVHSGTAIVHDGPWSADRIGHKFGRLLALRQAGLRVPELFCLPADAFDDALTAVGPPPRPDDVVGWCAAAAEALRSAPVPPSVLAAFDDIFGPDATVAVRACAVPSADGADGGEDGADPFAGMSDSFLYVRRDQVVRRVAECWASAFTERAVTYRTWRGLDPTRTRIAVGIQRMVAGTRSFVAFTRDPRDNATRTVIAAAYGIGEGVVQETSDVDHFFVERGRIRAEVVHKAWMVTAPDAGAVTLSRVPVPADDADRPVLTDDTVQRIVGLAARVERLFGGPQDIEGTVTADGVVHLVQARPLVAKPAPLYWGNHNITESYPGISGALTYSQAREFYRRAFGDLYHRMGVPERRAATRRHHLEQLVAYLNGRVYYRLDAWHALHGQLPVFELIRSGWEDAMGVSGPARETPQWTKRRAWAALVPLLARAVRHPGQVRSFLRWWDALVADAGDLSGRTPEQLIGFYRRMWTEVGTRWGVTLTNSVYGLLAVRATTALLDRWAGGDRRLLAGLLIGGRDNRSLRSVRAGVALAERISADAGLTALVLSDEASRRIWSRMVAGEFGAPLATAATHYVRTYGDRAMHDLKLEAATPRQRPWMVLDQIRPYVAAGRTVAGLRADGERAARDAARELRQACRDPLRRSVIRLFARLTRSSIRMREDTRFCRTQLYGLSRQVMWRLGAELARAGRLDEAMDVRDLTVHEVMGAFDGTLPGADLRGLVAVRRAERDRWEQAGPTAPLLASEPGGPWATASTWSVGPTDDDGDGDGVLRGLGSSAGVVRAPARIVLGTDIAAESCRGTILVARETDPGWLSLMMSARGLVVERGTLLSHTAITGRLLGIPTVVAVSGATTRIPDGALIELDGAAGTVRVIEG